MFIGDKVHRNVLISCDHGLMIVNRFDCNNEQVGQGQWLLDHGNASTPEAYTTVEAIKNINNPVIFDIGANIGTYLTLVARGLPNAKIFCFEPQRPIFQILCGNIAINNLYNCYCYNNAIGSTNEIIEINEPDYSTRFNYGAYSLIERNDIPYSNNKVKIEMFTLDSFVSKYSVEKVDFIKVDVEGMEKLVLDGAQDVIKTFNPILYIEHSQYAGGLNSIADKLKDYLGKNYHYKIDGNNLLAIPFERNMSILK